MGLLTLALLPGCSSGPGPQTPERPPEEAAGTYTLLSGEQQRLIDEYLSRYNRIRGTDLSISAYDDLPHSVRTTYQAVTHALLNTDLTDHEDNELGTALSLVDAIDMVHGQIVGAGGDQQFRVYAVLRDDALLTLESSREFSHDSDNTFFHTDYPINYRQSGVPSIQFSIAADGLRADIDVDYRSTQFPMVLFDGHLSVANSDVRAAGNHLVHVSRWDGLRNWWRELFTLHDAVEDDPETANRLAAVGAEPRFDDGADFEIVAEDFLSTWLVDGDAARAARYYAEPALNCAHGIDGDASDALAELRIVAGMELTASLVSPAVDLAELLQPQPVPNPAMRPISHSRSNLFTVLDVPPTLAAALTCPGGDSWRQAARVHNRRGHRAVSVSITGAEGASLDLFQLWSREGGYWKIIGFHYDGYRAPQSVLQLEMSDPLVDAPTPARASRDEEFIGTVDDYLETWFIDHAYEGLRSFYSSRCYACAQLLQPELPPAGNDDEAWRQLRQSIERIAEAVGRPGGLGEEITAATPWNPLLPVMPHPQDDVYTIVDVPDHLAASFDCTNRAATRARPSFSGEPSYGRYRAVVFRLRLAGEAAPAFLTLWERDAGVWRIASFEALRH